MIALIGSFLAISSPLIKWGIRSWITKRAESSRLEKEYDQWVKSWQRGQAREPADLREKYENLGKDEGNDKTSD